MPNTEVVINRENFTDGDTLDTDWEEGIIVQALMAEEEDENVEAQLVQIEEEPLLSDEELGVKDKFAYQDQIEPRDIVGRFIADIVRFPLLSSEEEKVITRSVRAGMLAKKRLEAGQFSSAEEEKELIQAVTDSQSALETLINANQRLVLSIAKKYYGNHLGLLDRVNEGNKGLYIAAERFDPGRGYKFSTYATWWIRQRIRIAVITVGQEIKTPANMFDLLEALKKARKSLVTELERNPTNEELFARFNEKRRDSISQKKFENLLVWEVRTTTPARLNKIIGDGENGNELGDMFADETELDAALYSEESDLKEILAKLLADLPEREREILKHRFGFYGEIPTLEVLGEKLEVTRERVRQLEIQALNRLRRADKGSGNRLREYLSTI